MKNTLLLIQYVRKFLVEDEKVKLYVKDKVYPLDALQGTSFPFIVLTRQSITPFNSKDGHYQEECAVQVTVVANNYTDSVELANKVRECLECNNYRYKDDEINIVDCMMTGCYEAMYNGAYLQTLDFQYEIQ